MFQGRPNVQYCISIQNCVNEECVRNLPRHSSHFLSCDLSAIPFIVRYEAKLRLCSSDLQNKLRNGKARCGEDYQLEIDMRNHIQGALKFAVTASGIHLMKCCLIEATRWL